MIRMIAQDFAGAARVQCILGSFRSISDEFRMSDCQRISLCRPSAARKQETLFSEDVSVSKTLKMFQMVHYHHFFGPHLQFSQLRTFQPNFCWAKEIGCLQQGSTRQTLYLALRA